MNRLSARVRIVGEEGQVTFRSGDLWGIVPVVPGHVVTLVVEKRWTWRDDAYASGRMENPRVDVPKLGLEPLPLEGVSSRICARGMSPTGCPIPMRRSGESSLQSAARVSSPFLRCLHGFGLCLWRVGKLAEAQQVFEAHPVAEPQ